MQDRSPEQPDVGPEFQAILARLNELPPERKASLEREAQDAADGHAEYAQGLWHLNASLLSLRSASRRSVPGAQRAVERIGESSAELLEAVEDSTSEPSEPTVRLDKLESLERVIKGLTINRTLAETLQTVSDGAVDALGYGVACVHLVRPDGDLVVVSVSGSAAIEALFAGRVGSRAAWDRRLSTGEDGGGLCFIAYTEGGGLDADDVPEWPARMPGPVPLLEGEWHPGDRLFAPMYATGAAGGELLGVISVDRPRNGRRPGAWGRKALQMYAFQAAIAISDARLRANMQRALDRLEREQQALRASEESFRQAFEYAPSGMAIAEMGGDQHGRILRTNDALCRLLGRPASVMRRYSFADLVHPEDIGTLLRTSAEGGRAELRLARRDGTYVWVSLRNSVVADAADGPRFLLTHVEDVEERKRRELQLAHLASRDSLTGLPNSAELRSRLSARLCPGDAEDVEQGGDGFDHHVHTVAPPEGRGDTDDGPKGLAVLFCDLDGFKSINDRFGHATGDAILVEVARRLTGSVRDGDTVARLGGDEFVVLADGLGRADAQDFAVRLRNAIIPPIRVDGRAVRVGANFGIGWAHCGMTADDVLHSADQQMYVEKTSRRKEARASRHAREAG